MAGARAAPRSLVVNAGGEPLLSALDVSRTYGRRVALRATTVAVHAGQTVALVGPNGAGKSTLLAIFAGALEPSGGRVVTAPAARRVGWVPQRPALYSRLSARENLLLFARLERVPEPAAVAARTLERLELPDDDRPAARLSGGNLQRLNLGIALLAEPDVLLLDEPTAALDPRQRRRLWDGVALLREHAGAVMFATQNLEEVDAVADRVIVMRDGAVVFDGDHESYGTAPEAQVFG